MVNMTDMLSALAGIAAAVIAVVAAGIAHTQARVAVRAQDVSVLLPLYQAHVSADFVSVRQLINRAAETTAGNGQVEPSSGNDQKLRDYINYLTFVCIMADEKLVTERHAAAIFEAPIANCLNHCDDYIQRVRSEDNPEFAGKLRMLKTRAGSEIAS
jgi:hypothetical protein